MIVLFEDNHCLVVYKPARLLTASDKSGDETLVQWVREYNSKRQKEGRKGYVAPLHMLDRPVSGVVMFAVSSKAASRMAKELREGAVEKVYIAIVEGRPAANAAELTDWLVKDHETNIVRVTPNRQTPAKQCRLEYKLLGYNAKGYGVLEIRPKTGRSHQIRVQLSSRGMSILGDVKYGARDQLSDKSEGIIALHAHRLTFSHPISKERITVKAPLPDYFSKMIHPLQSIDS